MTDSHQCVPVVDSGRVLARLLDHSGESGNESKFHVVQTVVGEHPKVTIAYLATDEWAKDALAAHATAVEDSGFAPEIQWGSYRMAPTAPHATRRWLQ